MLQWRSRNNLCKNQTHSPLDSFNIYKARCEQNIENLIAKDQSCDGRFKKKTERFHSPALIESA